MRIDLNIKLLVVLASFSSCQLTDNDKKDDNLIAEAYNQKLYEGDLKDYLSDSHSSSDSQFVITQYVDNWLMDIILLEEAKRKVKKRSHIQALVKKYEQSLLLNELESIYIKEELDTFINHEEIDSFFQYHIKDFQLQEPIVRFLFIKLPSESVSDTFTDLWKTEDIPALKNFVRNNNGTGVFEINDWQYLKSLKNILPAELFTRISLKKPDDYSFTENDNSFYIKVLEAISENDTPPVSFVKDRIKIRILQDRIKVVLNNKKNQLFNDRIKSKEIKIYGK